MSELFSRFRDWLHRDRLDAELAEELRFHREQLERDVRIEGVAGDEAPWAARRRLGNVTSLTEETRDWWSLPWLDHLHHDLRYALRALARQRIFTMTAVLTFAIGLGATTAILTLVNAAWFSWSGAYADADRLVRVQKQFAASGTGPTSPFDFRDWQREAKSLTLAGYLRTGVRIRASGSDANVAGGEPVAVGAVATTANLFAVLGLHPALGRFYRADEEQWGRNRVVVLGYTAWQKYFAGDPRVVGARIMLDDTPAEVIGVAPRGAWFSASPPDVFMPLAFAPDDPSNARHSHFIRTVARLAPGVTLDQSLAELRGIASRIAREHSENEGTSAVVESLGEVVLGDVKPTLRMLMGAVLLVLVIACANVANLMLVRGAARFREMAVRSALGASIRRITQQLLVESVLLATFGGLVGIGVAVVIVRLLGRTMPLELPRVADAGVHLDWRVALVSLGIVLASGLLCGVLPSLQIVRDAANRGAADALRAGSRGVAGSRSTWLRSTLVVGQVAVALVLLVTSGLFARSLVQLQRQDVGVRPDNVLTVAVSPPRASALDTAASVRYIVDVIRRVSAVPGVAAAGVSSHLPMSGGGETKSFWVEGKEPTTRAEIGSVVGRMETASSLQAIGATLLRGRWFTEADRGAAPRVALLSERVAKRYFDGEDPIGKRISLHRPEALNPRSDLPRGGWPRWTVIGVVKDVNYGNPRDEPESAVYVHYPQGAQVWGWGARWLVVRTTGAPAALAPSVRSALREADPTLPLGNMLPLTERMSVSLRAPKFTAGLVGTFALVAVLLGAIGLYGVIAYSVSQETRSFGVRIALGATTSDVSRHVLRRGLRLAALGIVAGVIGSLAASSWIRAQLFGVAPSDPATYVAAIAALLGLTLLASYIPARRAARVDPLLALRAD